MENNLISLESVMALFACSSGETNTINEYTIVENLSNHKNPESGCRNSSGNYVAIRAEPRFWSSNILMPRLGLAYERARTYKIENKYLCVEIILPEPAEDYSCDV